MSMHAVLLLAVLIGFAHTFYLRPLFSSRLLPSILYVHGAVLTVWFLLTVLQGWLVLTQRVALHRRTGYAVAIYAALVVVMGLAADLRMVTEITSPKDPENILFWGNLFSLVLFATYVSLAVIFRKHPEVHMRVVLLASISIVGPALARFADFLPGGFAARPVYAVAGLLGLFGSLIAFDLTVRRRPHPASWIGAIAFVASLVVAAYLALSGIGYSILHA
jgi:hypothetical protein